MERAGDDPDARAEFLESSGQQIERLDWLAQNLLELSKLDSGLVLLDLRPDDLRAAVESAVEQTAAAAARARRRARAATCPTRRSASATTRSGSARSWPTSSATRSSSRRAAGRSTVELAPAGRRGARIEVADTGVGIDPAELPRIFERFYRGSRANEARGSGSGLGLAIVRSIVDMHGGTIAVESRVGAGVDVHGRAAARPASRGRARRPRQLAAVASAAAAPRRMPGGTCTETSPTDRPQVNPEPAP